MWINCSMMYFLFNFPPNALLSEAVHSQENHILYVVVLTLILIIYTPLCVWVCLSLCNYFCKSWIFDILQCIIYRMIWSKLLRRQITTKNNISWTTSNFWNSLTLTWNPYLYFFPQSVPWHNSFPVIRYDKEWPRSDRPLSTNNLYKWSILW